MRWLALNRKHRIAHLCGHARAYTLTGRKSARRRQAILLSSEPCPACAHAARAHIPASRAGEALPALRGDPGACADAQAIRRHLLDEVDALVTHAHLGGDALVSTVVHDIRCQRAAQWWLRRRDIDARQLIAEQGRTTLGLDR